MNRVAVLSTVTLVVAAMIGGGVVVSAATAASGTQTPGPQMAEAGVPANESNVTTSEPATEIENDSDTDISAGARLAGIIGAQEAEHSATFETKTFETAFQGAASEESKAMVVARSTERIQNRIQVLENETEALEAAYTNGSVSNGTYHGKMTSLTARIQALERRANQTSLRGQTLPAAALEARGLDQNDLTDLENRTHEASSPQAAAIAKQVAGPTTGLPPGPPETVPGHGDGPPEHVNGPQSGDERGTVPEDASGDNGSASESGPSNSANATNGPPDSSHSPGPGEENTTRSNEGRNTAGQGPPFTGPETDRRNGQNDTPASANGSGHPDVGSPSALEFFLGFLG